MPASQISFVDFALAQQAAASCTPLVQNTAIEVVAHPVAADVGECIPVRGVAAGSQGCHRELRDDFVDDWLCSDSGRIGGSSGAGMDAPSYLPSGSHTVFICGERFPWRYAVVDGFGAYRAGY